MMLHQRSRINNLRRHVEPAHGAHLGLITSYE